MAAPTLANASEGGDRHYQTVWNIERDPSQLGVRSTATGRPILEQRLLPLGLAVTEEDIFSDSGKVLVNKGSQLFQLDVKSGKTFCVVNVPRPSFYRSFMLGLRLNHIQNASAVTRATPDRKLAASLS
jgi:hypothetical protein